MRLRVVAVSLVILFVLLGGCAGPCIYPTKLADTENRGQQMTIQRFDNGPRMSRAVVHGDIVYLAGLTAEKSAGQSVGEQTKEILGRIDGYLKQAGTDKSKLLQAVIWLQDVRTVDEFNKVWDAWVVPGSGPARACIEARLQSPAKMIEIQVTAAK
jgi:enamine deaminase RidA (YjgF/YER057c/UK114 family)